jgi:hypothetical protein
MKCRKNVRKLIQEYNAATPANKPNTPLAKFRAAVLALKAAPSKLTGVHQQANRYDDYVYIHQQSMADDPAHPMPPAGPHPGHRGPSFFPWHREFLRQFELDLRDVSGDNSICLPYWDFTADQAPANPGYPFFDDFLGGDGTGPNNVVQTGVFARANGWVLALNDDPGDALQRNFGGITPNLPPGADVITALAETTYDAAPWNRTTAANSSFRNQVEGWPNGPKIHNQVHVWVGGSMLPSTSPNDPVFFLNHAKEDELWAVWMQKHPAVPHYLPSDSEPAPGPHSHLRRLSDPMDSLAEYFGAGTKERAIDLLDHKAITWYDTDLPDIVLESGPAVAFNNTPAGTTVAKKIKFRIQTCRPVTFSLTGLPTGNFSVVGGPDFFVNPVEANDFETLEIEVRFMAVGANVQVSAVDIEARITDEEGYYAANQNDPFTVAKFHIELVANNIVTSDSSLVLVLDRSGSMSDVANNGFTKNQLLKSAVGVVHELMKDTDEIGVSRFDHEADAILSMRLKTAGLSTLLTGPDLDPRGATSIGAGILIGSGLINGPGATKPNKAMVVLTDGNENTAPLINNLPAGTISQTTFAVGFGQAGQVSAPILSQIAANTNGYLLVTGSTTDADRFLLAKFFIQILKDATLNDTIVDPEGQLLWNGSPQEIPFLVSDADVSLDVVALCPLPSALIFTLVTPGGKVITPAMSGVEPNVRYVMGKDVAYYRLMLPAFPGDAAGSHRGTWKAVLRLNKLSAVWEYIRNVKDQELAGAWVAALREFAEKPLPYNLTAHTFSNLRLDASLRQSGFAPGATAHLTATLWEYQIPLRTPAVVWADVRQPNGAVASLPFALGGDGAYHADWVTNLPGVYRFTVHAEGRTGGNARFTREKVLTAGVWAGGDRPYDPQTGDEGGGGRDALCCLLEPLLASPEIQRRLKELGIDPAAWKKCLEHHCRKGGPNVTEVRQAMAAPDPVLALSRLPEVQKLLAGIAAQGVTEERALKAAATTPVVRTPRKKAQPGNMFVLEGDEPKKEKPHKPHDHK